MASAVLYTTRNAIRGAIGVSEIELLDANIDDLNVEDELFIYFAKNVPTHAAIFAAGSAVGATDEEKLAFRKLKKVCQYAAACIVLQTNQYRFEQSTTSGGVTKARFGKDDLETIIGRLSGIRDEFLDDLNGVDPLDGSGQVSPLVTASPAYDPVAGP